jgi:hypothetical protein
VPVAGGDVVVFDRGYTNYEYFKGLCEEKAGFVTRLKSNEKYKRVKKNPVKTGSVVVSEYEIIIPSLSKDMLFRKIIVKDPETGKRITLLTNNLQWSPATIGAVADRTIFQGDKTEPEDKTVLWQFEECRNDTNLGSVNSVLVVLSIKKKVKE